MFNIFPGFRQTDPFEGCQKPEAISHDEDHYGSENESGDTGDSKK